MIKEIIYAWDGEVPKVDYVGELVRCRDCRWGYPRKGYGETGVHCVFHGKDRPSEGFCDIGERNE